MVTPPYQSATNLNHHAIVHGFFGSKGGVSSGLFTSLNCSLQKGDVVENVMQNRQRICQAMGMEPMVSARQVHKAEVLIVDAHPQKLFEGDAMVTSTPGRLLAIQTADCAPILLVDPITCVIGAIHAGWRSAVQGIVQNTITAMQSLGAERQNIIAAIGPCIQQPSFEVGTDVFAAAGDATFFVPTNRDLPKGLQDLGRRSSSEDRSVHDSYMRTEDCADQRTHSLKGEGSTHYLFDLPGFLLNQLKIAGITNAIALPLNTYTLDRQYFSYRRACHLQQSSCGGQLSVIGLVCEHV